MFGAPPGVRPEEVEEIERRYAEAAQSNPTAAGIGDFAGSAFTPENAAAGEFGGAVLSTVAKTVGPIIARRLQKAAINQGRKALSGIGTPLAARRPIPEAAVQEALDSGAIRPLGTVTGTAARLERSADALGAEYGDILAALETRGVTGPNAVVLAQKIGQMAKDAELVSLGSARPKILADAAAELPSKVNPAPFASKRLGLGQAEEIKRGLQAEARREYDKIARQYTTAGETKKELAAIVRAAIEDEVKAQAAKAPEAAAAFEPVKAKLANTLEALKHAEEGAARAARRKPISLTSTIAGSAAGAATGSPAVGVASALGHGIADARLASTLAAVANRMSRAPLSSPVVTRPAAQVLAKESTASLPTLIDLLRGLGLRPAEVLAEEEDRR